MTVTPEPEPTHVPDYARLTEAERADLERSARGWARDLNYDTPPLVETVEQIVAARLAPIRERCIQARDEVPEDHRTDYGHGYADCAASVLTVIEPRSRAAEGSE